MKVDLSLATKEDETKLSKLFFILQDSSVSLSMLSSFGFSPALFMNVVGYFADEARLKYDIDLTVPEGVTHFGSFCKGYNARDLEGIHLPSTVTSIDFGIFEYLPHLRRLTVSPNSSHYTAKHGVLFSKDGKELLRHPRGLEVSTYVVPDGVECIRQYAFSQCFRLESINLPESLTTIGAYALNGCTRLRYLDIPDSVTWLQASSLYNTDIETLLLPKSLESLSAGKALGWSSLKRLFIPKEIELDDSFMRIGSEPRFVIYTDSDVLSSKVSSSFIVKKVKNKYEV